MKKLKSEHNVPLRLKIISSCGRARNSILTLPHGDVPLPTYMPVGTKGTLKGLTSDEIDNLGVRLMLANTYHLNNSPGPDLLKNVGGLHKFMNWKYNLLTDSGGFQMVSLNKFCTVTDDYVEFEPVNSSYKKIKMRPEDSIHVQNCIGADIMMALDDVVKTTSDIDKVESAMHRTIAWVPRNLKANLNKEKQVVFPIIQGGLDDNLRKKCIEEITKNNAFGFAIGGLSGGEKKTDFIRTVSLCTSLLPKDKPRYLMGVGYQEDLVLCALLGVDMFDCVFPTRTARFGCAFTRKGNIKLKNKKYEYDFTKIDENCDCECCKYYTKSFLHQIVIKEEVACHLLSKHNIRYLINLMKELRENIDNDTLGAFAKNYFEEFYQGSEFPDWVKLGLELSGLYNN